MGMYSRDELDSIYGDLNADACDFEDSNFHYSTETEWDNADAAQRGEENPEAAWVCTDRDAWHQNPHYRGPAMPHPEEAAYFDIYSEEALARWREQQSRPPQNDDGSNDIPF